MDQVDRLPEIKKAEDSLPEIKKADKQKVSFGNVHIHEFETIIGDNPSCKDGPPLAFGENANNFVVDCSLFEDQREQRRYGSELILSPETRFDIILRSGCSKKKMYEALALVKKSRTERRKTNTFLGFSKFEEAMQSASRKFKRTLKPRSMTKIMN